MNQHAELDQLSAYLDGELDATERTALEAHLPSCAECRSTLDALRATIADLAALPEPVPSEQDSWALRSAIARRRAPVKQWHRAAWAAGAVAATLIAVVAIVRPGGDGGGTLATRDIPPLEQSGAGTGANIVYDAGAFTATSAQAKLLVLAGKVSPGAAVRNVAPGAGGSVAPGAPSDTAASDGEFGALNTGPDVSSQIDRCVSQIQRSTQTLLQPVEYDVATYESKPAFLLFFRTSERYELWVVQRPSCDVLYFAQAA